MLKTRENRRYQILCNVVLALLTIFMVFPFALLFMSSITEENTLIMNGYSLFPRKLSLEAYKYIFQNGQKIFHAYGVTIFVTVAGTCINLWMSSMLAFGLSRKNLPFRRVITFYVFFTMLFNGGLVPTYMMYTGTFHIKNTIFAMIVPNLLMIAVNVLLVRTYFTNSIPEALYEAAEIDGATIFQRIRYITLPSIRPTLVTMVLLQVGRILRGDFEMFYQIVGNNGQLFNATDVIDTYVFRSLITNPDIGMTAAATFYQSVLCFAIIMIVNTVVKKIDEDYALF